MTSRYFSYQSSFDSLLVCLVNKSKRCFWAPSRTLSSEQQALAGFTSVQSGATETEKKQLLSSMPPGQQSTLSFINLHTALKKCHPESFNLEKTDLQQRRDKYVSFSKMLIVLNNLTDYILTF